MKQLIKNPLRKLSTLVIAAWLTAHGSLASAATALARIEQSLVEDSQIMQVSSGYVMQALQALGELDDNKPRTLVFDVREPDEFAVSHLPGAIRVAPDTAAEQFMHDYGSRLEGVTPIFYCSVGKRSTALAEAVVAYTNKQALPVIPVNLRGGIFRWHNEGKPLQNSQGATDQVHPYSWYWRRLLKHPERSAYEPALAVTPDDPANR
jgi:rhodanese-related sulfurtransferase